MKFIKLKLFSPIMVKGEAPYENPWDSGDDYRFLIEREKKKCRKEIYVSSCNALTPVFLPLCFESRIYSAVPDIEENDGKLMLCLNCECYRKLSEGEIDELCGWWENVVVEANERLHKKQVKTKELGRIIIYLWFMKGWTIDPVFPVNKGGR
ncbi:hypothetical protein [Ruminococcus sp.]|uniref:hypothetical protein n=1 Tax=Ruminococcus sp. TaxID=41978 RepID=UPI0025F03855|nr:hypothetical protein [Ruminococcus sp.]